ncbi:MAG: tetratricopeptide repeat protein [Saprospiraceae bacterium]|nr:tetratricopeptide repeat protein [Saprospiraceae bacterium]
MNQQITLLEAIAHPNEAQKRELEQLNHERSAIFWALLDQELNAGDYTEAENLLTEAGSKIAQRNLIGLKTKRGNYLAAQQLLNNYPSEDNDDLNFKAVQALNLRRLSESQSFVLAPADETLLYNVAGSKMLSAAYARGLLSLLKGEQFKPELPDIPEEALNAEGLPSTAREYRSFQIYPNPGRGEVTVKFPFIEVDTPRRLEVYNITGTRVLDLVPDSETLILDSATIGFGVFTAILCQDGQEAMRLKFVLLK